MLVEKSKVDQLIDLVNSRYFGWKGFEDDRFLEEERDYKVETVKRAKELLNETVLAGLIESKAYSELFERIEKIGKDNNLLFNSIPTSGDLRLLFSTKINKEAFSKEFFNLLYGSGSSEERLEKFCNFVEKSGEKSYWTFPTYFLFIVYPESEYFVKPSVVSWFANFFGFAFSRKPDARSYKLLKDYSFELMKALSDFNPKDMIDIQSFIWVAYRESIGKIILPQKKKEFGKFFNEFLEEYFNTEKGQAHFQEYESCRKQGRKNFEYVLKEWEKGNDITDLVLKKLLPYDQNSAEKDPDVWNHVAPAVNISLKKKYESIGWVKPDGWSKVTEVIFTFIKDCYENPDELEKICERYD
ncbi:MULTISPECIES: hypothetical protein [Kosmotoga]|uniref:Uncharacterized protein n=1 Tax=Kosmotoga olearia (strain ATCC BAA-1733 / DSM 21960 / TBF 19.5.1) TaxID=521045 RepID=C5CG00_KOSOT|nr:MULTISPECIES: hypothetical protein [Kosmotoga]ACR80494.1 hypothetical protein Kole_1810 [Kosmotoga olearia TBF 19.5.1]MDI3524174.1 hypothetical protein [Kosmotoga sp.]MDK2954053.1 hypothetical protein [Kosmotoga sp.]